MTDKELIQLLRTCITSDCRYCDLFRQCGGFNGLLTASADRLEALLAENEWLKAGKDTDANITAVMVARRGRWVKHEKRGWICTSCGSEVLYDYTRHRYCHVCGARMDGGDNHA